MDHNAEEWKSPFHASFWFCHAMGLNGVYPEMDRSKENMNDDENNRN